MKTRKSFVLGGLIAAIAITTMGQSIIPIIVTTAYTRIFLKAADAATARAILGVGSGVATNLNGVAIGDGAGNVTGTVGTAGYVPVWSATTPFLTGTSPVFVFGSNVGIGTLTAAQKLEVAGHLLFNSSANVILMKRSSDETVTLSIGSTAASDELFLRNASGSGDNRIRIGNGYIAFNTEATANRMFINSAGNVGIGVTSFGTSAAKNLVLGSGTAPTTSPADAAAQYTVDQNGTAGNAGWHLRTESNNIYSFGTNAVLAGKVSFPSLAIQTNAAANAIIFNRSKVRVYGSGGGAVTLTATPTIADGIDGDIIYIQGTDDTATITIQDQGTLPSSNLELSAATITLGKGDIVSLMFDAADGVWYQATPLVNN